MITKILAGGLAVLLGIAIFLYYDGEAAKERAAVAETALETQKDEVDKANIRMKELKDVIEQKDKLVEEARLEREQFRKLAAERELAFSRLTDDAGSVAAFNVELRHILERSQGFRFNYPEAGEAATGSADNGSHGIQPKPMSYLEFARAAATNLGRCADTLHGVYGPGELSDVP